MLKLPLTLKQNSNLIKLPINSPNSIMKLIKPFLLLKINIKKRKKFTKNVLNSFVKIQLKSPQILLSKFSLIIKKIALILNTKS
jgi:uncharacterized protein YpbB